jgi:hypothetical protein
LWSPEEIAALVPEAIAKKRGTYKKRDQYGAWPIYSPSRRNAEGSNVDTFIRFVLCPLAVAAVIGYSTLAFARPKVFAGVHRGTQTVIFGLIFLLMAYNAGVLTAGSSLQTFILKTYVDPLIAQKDTSDEPGKVLSIEEKSRHAIEESAAPMWAFVALLSFFAWSVVLALIAGKIAEERGKQPREPQGDG